VNLYRSARVVCSAAVVAAAAVLTVAMAAPAASYAAPNKGLVSRTVQIQRLDVPDSWRAPAVALTASETATKRLPRVLLDPWAFLAGEGSNRLSNVTDAVTFALYGNYVRNWGIVTELYDAVFPVDWRAFITLGADGVYYRWECGESPQLEALACDEIELGDSILVNGHLDDRLTQDFDGPANYSIPNGIYRCEGSTPSTLSGPCELLTP
jgi:hypothetical protein